MDINNISCNIHVIIPAAGIGARMQADRPKQYLNINNNNNNNKTVLEYTIDLFKNKIEFKTITLAIAAHDEYFASLNIQGSAEQPLYIVQGGAERVASVQSALQHLENIAQPHDWILVHDAARPCLHPDDLQKLLEILPDEPIGALLGAPLADTVKYSENGTHCQKTIPRQTLWAAYTPQVFRFNILQKLNNINNINNLNNINIKSITDEASFIEQLGLQPRLVVGRRDNIKITCPEDLNLAAFIINNL
jgi:2-C-methyl-D-erythritol 4-phosphate cytidylyltransferase